MPIGIKLQRNLDKSSVNKDFKQQIGSLIYLTIFTRPNLVYNIKYLARFIFNTSVEYLKYIDYVVSYLFKTKNLGLDLTLQSAIDFSTKTNNCISLLGISNAN